MRLEAAEAERKAAAEARDEARTERNAWMSRAKAAALPAAPPPQAGRPTSGARPAPDAPDADPPATAAAGTEPDAPDAELPATASEPSPHERRTIRIGERPLPGPPGVVGDPMRGGRGQQLLDTWGPRVAAVATLLVLLAVVALVLTRAL
jgi:hypothetical protein